MSTSKTIFLCYSLMTFWISRKKNLQYHYYTYIIYNADKVSVGVRPESLACFPYVFGLVYSNSVFLGSRLFSPINSLGLKFLWRLIVNYRFAATNNL